jgi:hypothetical protein
MGHWIDATKADPVPPAPDCWPPLAARAPQPGDGWPKQDKPAPPPIQPAPVLRPLPADPVVEYLGPRIGCDYSPAWAQAYCQAIADGETIHSLSLRPDQPTRATVRARLGKHPEFARAYAVAWQARADARADRMDAIAERVIDGTLDPDAARVALQHYKWAAGVENRGKYGDRLGVQPVMPPPSVPVAGEITLDRSNPRESERIVMSVLGML